MAGKIEPAAKGDKASKRRKEISKSIEELAELFETRKAMALEPGPSKAGGQRIEEIEETISAYLKPRKSIQQGLKLLIDRRLGFAVFVVRGLLETLQECSCILGDFDHRVLRSMADDVGTTVERLTAELSEVMPRDWAHHRYPNGPKDAAVNIVASLNGLSATAVYSRIRNVDDEAAWLAARERMYARLAQGGEVTLRAVGDLEHMKDIFAEHKLTKGHLEGRLK